MTPSNWQRVRMLVQAVGGDGWRRSRHQESRGVLARADHPVIAGLAHEDAEVAAHQVGSAQAWKMVVGVICKIY